MARDIRCVPCEEEHERCAECSGQERRGEETGFVLRDAVRIEPDHQACAEDGGDNGDKHSQGSIAPFVGKPAHGEDTDGGDGAGGRVEHEGLLGGIAEGGEEDGGEVRETAVGDGGEEGGEADEPDADVAEGFEDLGAFDAGVLGAAQGMSV